MMTKEERKAVYLSALQLWGAEHQMIKAVEELAELTQALCKYLDGKTDHETIDHIREEMADVHVVLEQMHLIFGYPRVEQWIDYKVDRLQQRIEKSKCGVVPD